MSERLRLLMRRVHQEVVRAPLVRALTPLWHLPARNLTTLA